MQEVAINDRFPPPPTASNGDAPTTGARPPGAPFPGRLAPDTAPLPASLRAEVEAIARIEAVPTILDVVCRITGMGFAAVARVTPDRWIACRTLDRIGFGLKNGDELEIATTFCREIVDSGTPLVISDVAASPLYCAHPIPAMYGFRSYISAPIVLGDGRIFGTLCAVDPAPAPIDTPETLGLFRLLAELIAAQLTADERLRSAQAELVEQRELAELREQFIAVLGHDLRNPVASIASGTRLLARSVADEPGRKVLALMQSSVVRVSGLIDNLMDFARARLGDGMQLDLAPGAPLEAVLENTIEELRSIHPERPIRARIEIGEAVPADGARVAQLLSNLLGNALSHGTAEGPVRVEASTRDGAFELSVANPGPPIPPEVIPSLFRPFFRGSRRPNQQGLGLGLFIASEIARLHGGTLKAGSANGETRFTFRMPLRPAP